MSVSSEKIVEKLKDKLWRMENLYLILPEDSNEPTALTLRDEQKAYLTQGHNKLFIPKARKLGISTVIVLDFLDHCIFNKNAYVGHLDLKEKDCAKKLGIAMFAWKNGVKHPNPVIASIWKGIHEKIKLIGESKSRLEWSNGSVQEASQSFTGTTPGRLHLSEFAVLADEDQNRAERIIQGSLNAVPKNGLIVIETTMRKPSGSAYKLFKLAMSKVGQQLSPLDWNFLFFPWYKHPSYKTDVIESISESTIYYAKELKDKYGVDLSKEQMAWYDYKSREQGRFMKNEFPSVPEECVQTQAHGAIYPELTTLRMKGRVTKLEFDRQFPIYVSADLGISDRTALWVVQFSGRDILWHRFYMSNHLSAPQTTAKILKWEAELGITFHKILVPHDAQKRDGGSGKTYLSQMIDAGLSSSRVIVVNRTSNVWDGINWIRDNMNRMYFDVSTDRPVINVLGEEEMSGMSCLEAYRTKPTDPSAIFHGSDGNSDGADAARTFSQACLNQIISNKDSATHSSDLRRRPITQTGDFRF